MDREFDQENSHGAMHQRGRFQADTDPLLEFFKALRVSCLIFSPPVVVTKKIDGN